MVDLLESGLAGRRGRVRDGARSKMAHRGVIRGPILRGEQAMCRFAQMLEIRERIDFVVESES